MNSTNVSEDSDAYSEVDDHVDVETEDKPAAQNARDMSLQERLFSDNHKCSSVKDNNCDNCVKQTDRSSAMTTKKPAVRPSFLITDILSNAKRNDTNSDSSVVNTPCTPFTPCTPITNALDVHRSSDLLLSPRNSTPSSIGLTSPSQRCETPDSDDGKKFLSFKLFCSTTDKLSKY